MLEGLVIRLDTIRRIAAITEKLPAYDFAIVP
jgi:hypothetical protein